MSRVITHLKKDISSLTRYHPDASNRLCFLLGARNAIFLMNSVKNAPENIYLILNVAGKARNMEDVKKRVEKEINIQGYEFKFRDDLGDVIAVKTTDRLHLLDEQMNEDSSIVENKFKMDQTKLRESSTVIVKRNASILASLGASIYSTDLISMSNIVGKQDVVIQNMHYDIVGFGIAEMSEEEIERSPGRIAIRTYEGRYDIFNYKEQKRYQNGMYSVSTLPRILGMNVLKFKKNKPANIIVACQDNGEIGIALLKKAPEGSKVTFLLSDSDHKGRIEENSKRLESDSNRISYIDTTLTAYSKSRPKEKYTHAFVEFKSSESGMRPNPFFDYEENEIINFARAQFQGVRALALICENEAQISYVSHSLDPTENQEIVVQNFRQGNFSPLILNEEYLKTYPMNLYVIPEIPSVSQGGIIDTQKMRNEEKFRSCWMGIDSLKHESHAGFVAYFEFLSRTGGKKRRRT